MNKDQIISILQNLVSTMETSATALERYETVTNHAQELKGARIMVLDWIEGIGKEKNDL